MAYEVGWLCLVLIYTVGCAYCPFSLQYRNTIASLVSKYGLTDQVEVGTVGQGKNDHEIEKSSVSIFLRNPPEASTLLVWRYN